MVIFEGAHKRSEPTLTPWELQKTMGLGINVGNCLEVPFEGKFAAIPDEKHFQMFHEAGFANCRIPVSWGNHMGVEEPYTIDPKFLLRVEELVKHSMDQGLVTVITAHHEWWIDFDTSKHQKMEDWRFNCLPRFEAMWKQIAEHFQHHRQLLIFGLLNEPHAVSEAALNELHRCALVSIRHTNPSRIVTISGKDFGSPKWLLDNPKALLIPRDPQLMLEIHVTDPHGFAGTNPSITAWGSEVDRMKVKNWVDAIELFARARNLPVYCAEFGCSNHQTHDNGRRAWLEANWSEMRRKGFCASLWDDGDKFSIYSRKDGQWDQDVLVALQRSLPGLQGVSMYRAGGGLGGDSTDPTVDLQRRLELCFSRLKHANDDVATLKPLNEHVYSHESEPNNDDAGTVTKERTRGGGY